MPREDLEVCLSVDRRTLLCGFVCVHSLLSRIDEERRPSITVCHAADLPSPAESWRRRLQRMGIRADIKGLPLDVSIFRHCKSIYDSHAAYFRILAPDHIKAPRMIYTDTDVVFFTEIERFFSEDLQGAAIGMRSGPKVGEREVIERDLLLKCGKKAGDLYFGSGLAVVDTSVYRKLGISERCLEIIRNDSAALKHSDQSVWNAAIPQICDLGHEYIQTAPPGGSRSMRDRRGIVHFVGSPKPWDLFAEFFHPHARLWFPEAYAAGLRLAKLRRYFSASAWARARRIANQYRPWINRRSKAKTLKG